MMYFLIKQLITSYQLNDIETVKIDEYLNNEPPPSQKQKLILIKIFHESSNLLQSSWHSISMEIKSSTHQSNINLNMK